VGGYGFEPQTLSV